MAPDRPPFRPDLEGLRGIAILLVVLFHAGVPGFAGAFVGVDLFFVLSGFFITGLLARELNDNGGIDLGGFVSRRAARLLPVLLVVLLATLALSTWLYAPIDREQVATTARAAATYGANVEFARSGDDYFRATDNPLLHTWSLAVEEQFYIVWPLLLIGLAAFAARRAAAAADASPSRRQLGLLFGIVAGVSLLASLLVTPVAQSWAFFGMPTRIWEFAIGGLLALVPERVAAEQVRGHAVLVGAGLAAIALAVVLYDSLTPYPGIAALLPALGTAAVVLGGRATGTVTDRVMSATALQWLGRHSYAWYLWHWPLLVTGAVLWPGLGLGGKAALVAVAMGLAWATRRWIELPARARAERVERREWIPLAAVAAALAVALTAHLIVLKARHDTGRGEQQRFAAARQDRMQHDCWVRTIDDPVARCEFGDLTSKTVLVLLGDSHAEHWLGALDAAGKRSGWKVVAFVKGGCPVADMPEVLRGRGAKLWQECARFREAKVRHIIAMRPAALILSSWNGYVVEDGGHSRWQVTPRMWRDGLRRTYARVTAAGITTVAIRGTPRTWFDVPQCLSRRAARLPFSRACTYGRDESINHSADRAQADAMRGLAVRLVDMNDAICSTTRCTVLRDRVVMFTDDNHLTASFSRSLAPVVAPTLKSVIGR